MAEGLRIGESIRYRGYMIVRSLDTEFVTLIAHDSLKEAKEFIDTLIERDFIPESEQI